MNFTEVEANQLCALLKRLRRPPLDAAPDLLALGRRLVPHGFNALPVAAPPGAFVWLGHDHALVAGAWRPVRRAWEPGPPTEPVTVLRPAERFAPLPAGITACERFAA